MPVSPKRIGILYSKQASVLVMFALSKKWLLLIWYGSISIASCAPSSDLLILRVRKTDGSMDRIVVPKDQQESTTLASILSSYQSEGKNDGEEQLKCQIGTGNGPSRSFVDITNTDQSISSLNLKNGSIINILAPKGINKRKETSGEEDEVKKYDIERYTDFDPFPDIAKSSHSIASRRSRALSRLPSKRSMTYGDISKLRQHMHVIEPQPNGPITRIYMCNLGAQRFKDNCTVMPTKRQLKEGQRNIKYTNRCAILFGSVNTERVDQSKRKARTSLSTPLYEMESCKVVKVHAVWEPLGQNTEDYSNIWDSEKATEIDRALSIANALGLEVVGWIYSYTDDRQGENKSAVESTTGEDSLPVYGKDAVVAAMGQISNMQRIGRDSGRQFITLAMDGKTGATEAFQLSDVAVQMVAEGKIEMPSANERNLETAEPVVVDTKETSTLDSVLFLVNTAMLSHEGNFCGGSSKSTIKKGGTLTAKTKKSIMKNLDGDTEKLIANLCDFNTLMAVGRSIGKQEMSELCNLVKKFSRGQRKAAKPSELLKLGLRNLMSV